MSRRKGELTIAIIKRGWPHTVMVPREAFDCSVAIHAAYPSMALRQESICRRDRQYLRVFFTDEAEARLFCERAAGEFEERKLPCSK